MEVGYMKKDENCFCFQRNVSFFKSVYSLNFHVRLAYSLLFLCMAHTTFLQYLSWSFMTVGLYYIQRSRRISFGHWTELPPCNLFICLFSWYDFVRNLVGLYGVSVSQALALNFAVFSLFTSLQFLFHTSTLFTGVFYAYLRSSFLTHAQQASLENDQWVTSRKPYFSECTAC